MENYKPIDETKRSGFSSFQRKRERIANGATAWAEVKAVAKLAAEFTDKLLRERGQLGGTR